jgi:hypothetical protein
MITAYRSNLLTFAFSFYNRMRLDIVYPASCCSNCFQDSYVSVVSVLLFMLEVTDFEDGFGGLVVSMLASGSRVRGFEPDQSRWIFSDGKNSSACLPSEGK